MNTKTLKTSYFVLVGVELLAEALRGQFPHLFMFIKPLLMIILALYLYKVSNLQEKMDKVLLISLFFSWLGDCVLMFKGEMHFLGGLVSFLIAHILYIYVFTQQFKWQKMVYLSIFAILLYGIGLFSLILPKTSTEMRIPIIIYASILLLMVITSSGRKGAVSTQSFTYTFVGAILFMLSDSLIALNKFAFPLEGAILAIMITYLLGQYFIIEGYLKG